MKVWGGGGLNIKKLYKQTILAEVSLWIGWTAPVWVVWTTFTSKHHQYQITHCGVSRRSHLSPFTYLSLYWYQEKTSHGRSAKYLWAIWGTIFPYFLITGPKNKINTKNWLHPLYPLKFDRASNGWVVKAADMGF